MTGRVTTTNNGGKAGHTAWRGGTRLGLIVKHGLRYSATAPDGTLVGRFGSMAEAEKALDEREAQR